MPNFINTSSNMVQEVKNVIKGYGASTIRALAQEPVQNAKDARLDGSSKVKVRYRLSRKWTANGQLCMILTVTDSGTTGLQGPVLTHEDLKKRGYKLNPDENWAAFEGQGYTKENEDKLGSRGQGKLAFLYYSRVPDSDHYMLILYDTLLSNGVYRLGMRYAHPVDQISFPPYEGEEARQKIRTFVTVESEGDELSVPLNLEPLQEVGTRIIVPFLDERAIDAIQSGELARWLERCWWRAIQTGLLDIQIIDETSDPHKIQYIEWPEWWAGEPWKSGIAQTGKIHTIHEGCTLQLHEGDSIDDICVKRLVFLYDEEIKEDEIVTEYPEYLGIQMLRGCQWIETRGSAPVFHEYIPGDKRAGFRAFIEFDETTDKKLRHEDVEKPQHTGFVWNTKPMRSIKQYLNEKVKNFSVGMGWTKDSEESDGETNLSHRETNKFVIQALLNPTTGSVPVDSNDDENGGNTDRPWDVAVQLVYPNPEYPRVNNGESIRDIRYVIHSSPESIRRNVRLVLEWIDLDGACMEIWSKKGCSPGDLEFRIGDRQLVVRAVDDDINRYIVCPKPGLYRIYAVVYEGTRRVAKDAHRFYFEEDPPIRIENDYVVSISVENVTTPGEKRIQSGDNLLMQINGRNRTSEDLSAELRVRLKDGTVLVSDETIEIPRKPIDQDERRYDLHWKQIRLIHEGFKVLDDNNIQTLTVDPGKHTIQAYLLNGEETLAYGSYTLHFESEPGGLEGKIPFEPKQIPGDNSPAMWDLKMDEGVLQFPKDYPLLQALPAPKNRAGPFDSQNSFTSEISINGILEWALRPLCAGDPTNLEMLRSSKRDLVDDVIWDEYMTRLNDLANMLTNMMDRKEQHQNPDFLFEFAKQWRRTVASIYPVLRSA